MRLLMIGDVIGRPGRRAVRTLLPELRKEHAIDVVIANGENAAGGKGLTLETAQELLDSGVDIITSGNHIWEHKELIPYLNGELPILRPLNYPPFVPGKGFLIYNNLAVVNLVGRTFIGNFDCPFRAIDEVLEKIKDKVKWVVVDFHAEATSEKVAMGWYLDGRVSAVLGTHTHVGTIDARILPKGTAYVTDVGMTGPINSVIGVRIDAVLKRFLTRLPQSLPVATGKVIFNSLLVELDHDSGLARSILRITREIE